MREFLFAIFLIASLAHAGDLLPADAKLDGGKGGHWSIQTDQNWIDARRNEMDSGPAMFYTVSLPGGPVAKGLSIKLGEKNEASVCYDTATMSVRAFWRGRFLKFSGRRFGLIDWPKPDGEILWTPPAATPAWGAAKVRFTGLRGKTLDYSVDNVKVYETSDVEFLGDGQYALSRTIHVEPSKKYLNYVLTDIPGSNVSLNTFKSYQLVTVEKGGQTILFQIRQNSNITVAYEKETRFFLTFSDNARQNAVEIRTWSGKTTDAEKVREWLATPKPEDFFIGAYVEFKPNPQAAAPHAVQRLMTKGVISTDTTTHAVDTITTPYDNPHKALFFMSGIDFFANGDAAVCSLHGDVWIVRRINESLNSIIWQRVATGLYQPVGIKIIADKVHVMCRDRLMILNDWNGDGHADYYENFNDACKTSTGGHDYSAGLETDDAGNFYHVDPFGLHRISKNGEQYETLATGWRNSVSLSVGPGPDNVITVAPQQGTWTPASQISEVKRGGYYGFSGPKITPERPLGYDPPLCFIPRQIDNSTGGQLWVTSEKWFPFKGQLLNLSFGMCSTQLVLREKVDGIPQGGTVALPWRLLSGSFRGRFNPVDGQLYIVGTNGWQTAAQRDGSFQRVRYTGAKVHLPIAFNVLSNGIRLTFSEPLRREEAEDTENYSLEQWNYKYSSQYGSAEYSVAQPDKVGHDPVIVQSAKLAADGRVVFLEIPDIRPVNQLRIKYNLNAAGGARVKGDLDITINAVSKSTGP